jgi:hypothetical protein
LSTATIKELQAVVADENRTEEEREAAARHILTLQGQPVEIVPDITGIADDDPELPKFLFETASDIDRLFPGSVSTNLEGAKILLAKSRKQAALMAAVQDESLPIEERVEAAHQWGADLAYGKEHWASLGDAELIERLSIHPHTKRLQELSAYVCDGFATPATGDWQQYLRNEWAAIKEFRKLRAEFPLRQVAQREGIFNSTIVIGIESVASRVIDNSPKDVSHGMRARIYAYAKELESGRHSSGSERDRREQADAANLSNKTCCECYFVQPMVNAVCSLCGAVPFDWMPAKEYPANLELDNLRNMAEHATVEQLSQPRLAEWSIERPERERVIKNLLAARLRQSDQQQRQIERKPPPAYVGVTDRMVQAAIRHNELQVAKIDEQLAELNAQIGKAPEPEVKAAIPWYLEPSYLAEEKRREELERAKPEGFR